MRRRGHRRWRRYGVRRIPSIRASIWARRIRALQRAVIWQANTGGPRETSTHTTHPPIHPRETLPLASELRNRTSRLQLRRWRRGRRRRGCPHGDRIRLHRCDLAGPERRGSARWVSSGWRSVAHEEETSRRFGNGGLGEKRSYGEDSIFELDGSGGRPGGDLAVGRRDDRWSGRADLFFAFVCGGGWP
jgi:hypothetical protein